MKIVTQRTGLSAHVVRVWERRYGAVTPDRTGSNRRLYSEEEIDRLKMMATLTQHGHSIGQIAKLSTAELGDLVAEIPEMASEPGKLPPGHEISAGIAGLHDRAWEAIEALDGKALEEIFDIATREIGGSAMIEKIIVPLIFGIGERWDEGTISVAQERVASTVIQEVLTVAGRPHSETRGAPNLVVATPAGQLHELGAALVVCTARRRGWNVTYLGASIPAEEIAHTANVRESRAVALSIVYPFDDPGLPAELERLRRLLPDECTLIAGGRGVGAYADALEGIGAKQFSDLEKLKTWLDAERQGATPPPR